MDAEQARKIITETFGGGRLLNEEYAIQSAERILKWKAAMKTCVVCGKDVDEGYSVWIRQTGDGVIRTHKACRVEVKK